MMKGLLRGRTGGGKQLFGPIRYRFVPPNAPLVGKHLKVPRRGWRNTTTVVGTYAWFVPQFSTPAAESNFPLQLQRLVESPDGGPLATGDFLGKEKSIAVVHSHVPHRNGRRAFVRHIFVGVGKTESDKNGENNTIKMSRLQTATFSLFKKIKELRIQEARIMLNAASFIVCQCTDANAGSRLGLNNTKAPTTFALDSPEVAAALAKWCTMADYTFSQKKSDSGDEQGGKEAAPVTVKKESSSCALIEFECSTRPEEELNRAVQRGQAVGNAVNVAKELSNARPDVGVPKLFVDYAKQICRLCPSLKLRACLCGKQLLQHGLAMHYAVGRAAVTAPPQLIVIEYVGDKTSSDSTALVGKGVTFDCGGLHVKPFGSMENMHLDKSGAATVLATIKAVADLKLRVNVIAVVALAENAVDAASYKPSMIIQSLAGLTVEVVNTDAEGRLVLADAMSYVQDHAKGRLRVKATTVIDVATLTGAVAVALGSCRAGLFANDDHLRWQLYECGERVQELLWPLPIGDEHRESIKGKMADLANIGTERREAGSCTAAAFLERFVSKGVRWAHIDIAGAGMNDKMNAAEPKGSPGFGVQLLVEYLASQHK